MELASKGGAVGAHRGRRRGNGRRLRQGSKDMLHVRQRQGTTMRRAAALQRPRKGLKLGTIVEEGPEPREEAHLAKGTPDILQKGLLSGGGQERGQALPIILWRRLKGLMGETGAR